MARKRKRIQRIIKDYKNKPLTKRPNLQNEAYRQAMDSAPSAKKVFKIQCNIYHYNSGTDTWYSPPFNPFAGQHLYMPVFLFHRFDYPHYGITRNVQNQNSDLYPFDVNDNILAPPANFIPRLVGAYEVGAQTGLFQNDNAIATPRNTLTIANLFLNLKLQFGDLLFIYATNANFGASTIIYNFVKVSAIDRPYTSLLKENHKISSFLMYTDYQEQFNQPINFIVTDQVGRYKVDPYQPLTGKGIDTAQADFIRIERPFTADLHNGFSLMITTRASYVTFEFVGNY